MTRLQIASDRSPSRNPAGRQVVFAFHGGEGQCLRGADLAYSSKLGLQTCSNPIKFEIRIVLFDELSGRRGFS